MGRPEKPIDPQDGPVARFAYELRKLRDEAGAPGYRSMARRTGYSATTLSQAAGGERLPTLPVALAYVRACHGDVEEWRHRWKQVNAEATALPRPSEEDDEPPYRGLERFEPGDAELFFGREETAAQLVEMARRHRLSVVVGASGSGKSSLLRAGLIPQLRRPEQDADERPAAVRVLTPGARPMDRLDLLTPAKGRGDTWVLVDQFEELFTLCACPEDRDAFLERLLAAREPGSRLRVVLALRADFFARCAENHTLAAALNDATLLIGPMTAEQLRAAIVRPAQARGLNVERDLTARLLDEVADEPGALPLMSHALLETWRRRRGHILTQDAYQAAGGLHGAIARTAEDAYHQLTPSQATLARRILLRLIAPGDGTEDTHRPTPRTEFAAADSGATADTDAVLDRLARARLLTVDEGTVFLAHEKLITAWPRLLGWIDEERGRVRLHRQLTHDALVWHKLGRDPGVLYRGSRLVQADEAFTGRSHEVLNPLEAAFLETSVAAGRRHERRTRRTLITLATLLCVTLIAALVAYQQRNDAENQRHLAIARELAARAGQLSEQHPEAAMTLALRGYRQAPTTATRSSLLSAYARFYANQFTGHTKTVTGAAFAPNGHILATASMDHSVKLWDTRSHRLLATLTGHTDIVNSVAFSPDGRTLATAGNDHSVKLWDTHSHRLLATLTGHTNTVEGVAFSPDGRTLASTGMDGTVRLWRPRTHEPLATLNAKPFGSAVVFSPDGRTLASTGKDSTRLWNVTSRRPVATLTGHSGAVTSQASFADRHAILRVDYDISVTHWSTARPRTRPAPIRAPKPFVTFVASSDSTAVAGHDRVIRVWSLATGRRIATLPAGTGMVRHLAITPDGRTLAVGSDDGTIRVWDVAARRTTAVLRGAAARSVNVLALRPDGRALAAVSTDGTTYLWATHSGQTATPLPGPKNADLTLAFSPDGHTLAVGSTDGTVRLWDVAARRIAATLGGHAGLILGVDFSPDGSTLAATTYNDGSVRLWDTRTARLRANLTDPTLEVGLPRVRFSPNGHALATLTSNGARVWSTDADYVATRVCRLSTGHHWAQLLPDQPVEGLCPT
ncbi:cytochrome D1 domain-containing protein [Streptomyces iranensis]